MIKYLISDRRIHPENICDKEREKFSARLLPGDNYFLPKVSHYPYFGRVGGVGGGSGSCIFSIKEIQPILIGGTFGRKLWGKIESALHETW